MIMNKGTRVLLAATAAVTVLGVLPIVAGAGGGTPKVDSCGYPDTSSTRSSTIFNESTVMRGASVLGTGSSAQIAGFANDENGLVLGVNGASVFPNRTTSPYFSHISNPNLGDTTKLDASQRPQYPALFITKITGNTGSRAGDWQQNPANGIAHVNDIFGSWATGTVTTKYTAVVPTTKNNWNGVPDITAAQQTAFGNEGYGAEVRWNVSDPALHDNTGAALVPGNSYRFQIFTHDGDQNNTGGDAGEFCATLTVPGAPQVQTQPNGQTATNINTAIGNSITDTALYTGNLGPVTGSVTFNLYFQPNPQPATVCATPSSTPPGTKVFTETDPLVNGQQTSSGYDTTTQNALGVYYWQDVYNPPASGGNYTTITEGCGHETETVTDARIRLTPASATNIVNNAHTLTATVETTTDGANYSPVPGATVGFTLSGGSATFTGANSCGPTDANGQCQVSIISSVAGTTTIHATAANFTAPNTVGSFTESTGSGANDPDASKTYVNQICPGDSITTTSNDGTTSSGEVTATFNFVAASGCKTYTEFDAKSADPASSSGKSITFLSQQLAGAHMTATFDWGYFPYCRADATVDPSVPACPTTVVEFGDGTGFHTATYCSAADPLNTTTPWCATSRNVEYLPDPSGSGTTVTHITETWDGYGDLIFRHN